MNKELKTELLKALWIGHDVIEEGIANGWDDYKTRDSIWAAIAKLENEPVYEIKFEDQKMKTVRTDNAFPIPGLHADESFNGLTIRQYYAAKVLANPNCTGSPFEKAKWAFEVADALINFEEQGK